jgi:hypothetical protein
MMPDRSNYEIWIIDWLDGKLDESGIGMLMAFLEANPDLKEEAESLSISRLTSGNTVFAAKDDLKKTISELPFSQIEYLSVAYLENDINPLQLSELEQSLELNPENKRAFDKIQKTKLTPPAITYKNKYLLRKQQTGAKVFRFAFTGLSAAATIAVLIISYTFLQRYLSQKNKEPEQIVASIYTGAPFEVRTKAFTALPEEPANSNITTTLAAGISKELPIVAYADTSSIIIRQSIDEITGVPVNLIPEVKAGTTGNFLAATNNRYSYRPYDDERSKIGRFIARNFRGKILKEPVVSDAPLKTYEIAEAGVAGLNKLLGWDMALVATSDEAGELKSIYFSSRMLKFNAPVKKTEPLP